MPANHGKVTIAGGMDAVTVSTQMEVMAGMGVPADAAAITLAQEITADFCCPCHIDDVLTQAVAQEGFDQGAVML